MLARYMPPSSDRVREVELDSEKDLNQLLTESATQLSDRGIPAVELVGTDGSTLVVGQTKVGIVLLWLDAIGSSFHSVGSGANEGVVLLDYLGSYTEVPAEFVVSLELGRTAAVEYMSSGRPYITGLILEPD